MLFRINFNINNYAYKINLIRIRSSSKLFKKRLFTGLLQQEKEY